MANFVMSLGLTPPYIPQAVHFNGSTVITPNPTYTGLTGGSDSPNILCSFWFKLSGGDGTQQTFIAGSLAGIIKDPAGYIEATVYSAGFSSTILHLTSSSTFTTTSNPGWHHVCFCATGGSYGFYIDGISTGSNTGTLSGNMGFSDESNYSIGAGNYTLLYPVYGDLADVYWAPMQYLDLSNPTNLYKFISASGNPVNLGTNGSTPTGTAPIAFFSGNASTFVNNSGSGGGNWSVYTGSLSTVTGPP